ncbi:MAG: MFS transporter [Chloroflexota bacterium]
MSTTATTLSSAEQANSTYGLALTSLSHFSLELCHNFLPVLYPLLIVSMDLSYQQIGIIALIVGLLTSVPQPFLGFLSDRFGAYQVSGMSILWLGVLMSVVGLAPNYLSFAIVVGLASLGSAAYHPAGAVLASANSKAQRGMGMSIFSVGGNLGAALSPVLIAALVPWFGFNASLSILPVALVVSILLTRQTKLTVTQPSHSPNPTVSTAVGTATGELPVLWAGLLLLLIASMTRAWFQVSFMTYLPVWIDSGGGTLTQASQMLSVFAFSIGAGSMFGGTASDKVGRWIIVFISFALMAPAYWLFLHSVGLYQFLPLALLGFCIGNTYPIFILMAQDCWVQRAGVASGLIIGIGWAPGGLGASFTGYVADRSSLATGLELLLIPPLIGAICLVLWRVAGYRM